MYKSLGLVYLASLTLEGIRPRKQYQKIKHFGDSASFLRSMEANTLSSMITRFTGLLRTSEAWRCALWISSTPRKELISSFSAGRFQQQQRLHHSMYTGSPSARLQLTATETRIALILQGEFPYSHERRSWYLHGSC
jgi:hypothetical protein